VCQFCQHSCDSPVSRSCRLDTALHRQWNRPRLPAGLSGTLVYSAADRNDSVLTPALLDELVRTILLDIEGTTTPLDFVYKVLFPFALSHASVVSHK
jgi:hypothetical protein